MPFTPTEQLLLNTNFSYNTNTHQQLLQNKLNQFTHDFGELKSRSRPIFIAAIGTAATRLFGLYSFLMPVDLILFGFGLWKTQQTMAHHQHYQDSLTDILAIYDWCIPNGGALPPTNNADIQGLIESVGTLINGERINRLQPLMNGQQAGAGLGDYAVSGGRALLGLFGLSSAPQANANILDPQTFTLLVRNLVNGRSTSATDYYCYGEGGRYVGQGLQYGINTFNGATNMFNAMLPHFAQADNGNNIPHPHAQ